jgi:hypothetical protein
MYDLPDDFNPVAFVGAVLEKVSFGVGTIHLDLELNPQPTPGKSVEAAIVSLTYIKLQSPEGLHKIEVGAYADICKLGKLLNKSVIRASVIGRRSIKLEFGEGSSIELEDDGGNFESYHVYLPGVGIIYV